MQLLRKAEDKSTSEDNTYVRAKLTEIHGAIERLTSMLDKMVEVMSRMSKMPDTLEELSLLVTASNERIEELTGIVKGIGSAVSAAEVKGPADKGVISSLTAVLDTLDTQIREGVIASDLARRLNESAEMMEQKGGTANVVVKMQRWVRILRTYGRVDPISSADLGKLRADLKDWQREVSQMR